MGDTRMNTYYLVEGILYDAKGREIVRVVVLSRGNNLRDVLESLGFLKTTDVLVVML